MPILGLLRIKNEARWIDRVVRSISPICEKVIILDDHSTDGTQQICRAAGATVIESQFSGCDESRDKDFLLTKAFELVPNKYKVGVPDSPWWALLIDGDEELVASDRDRVH
jgi:glycosyltransferase involved in cell wall biosynthesis